MKIRHFISISIKKVSICVKTFEMSRIVNFISLINLQQSQKSQIQKSYSIISKQSFNSYKKMTVSETRGQPIDAHGLKIQGGYLKFLPKSLGGGVKGFRKNCQRGSTYFAFYSIFFNTVFKNLPGGVLFNTPSPLPPPPPCVHLWVNLSRIINLDWSRLSRLPGLVY